MKLNKPLVRNWFISMSIFIVIMTIIIIVLLGKKNKGWFTKLFLVFMLNFICMCIFTLLYIYFLDYKDLGIKSFLQSMRDHEHDGPHPKPSPYHIFYYSFIVQTTIGFGELAPHTDKARTITIAHGLISLLINSAVAINVFSEIGTERAQLIKRGISRARKSIIEGMRKKSFKVFPAEAK